MQRLFYKGTPLSVHRLRHEPLLKRDAFCVHIVSSCLTFSLSSSGKRSTTRGSMDVRVKPEHDSNKRGSFPFRPSGHARGGRKRLAEIVYGNDSNKKKKAVRGGRLFSLICFMPLWRRSLWRQKQFRHLQYRLWYRRNNCC